MKPLQQLKKTSSLLTVALLLAFGLMPCAKAVVPAPDGGYPGGNTAEGQAALLSRTTGGFNTAVGFLSLRNDTTGGFNTAIGAGSLLANSADQNTATGAGALLSNTTGGQNTANGTLALFFNTIGFNNTANGQAALLDNTTGSENTATGAGALLPNTTGNSNTANGFEALFSNTTGGSNTALGSQAGSNATTGNNNVYIGAGMTGVAGESNACYIASIFGQVSSQGTAVLVNSDGKLGMTTSARRFKDDIKPMDNGSEAILALKPVTFHYKADAKGTPQFGLIAEDVAVVNPDLVVRDKDGKPYSVRYDAVNAMLLNEFLKEHRKVEEHQATIAELKSSVAQQQKDFEAAIARQRKDSEYTAAQQQKGIEVLTAQLKEQAAQIQKVSAQIEIGKFATGRIRHGGPAPRVVLNNQ